MLLLIFLNAIYDHFKWCLYKVKNFKEFLPGADIVCISIRIQTLFVDFTDYTWYSNILDI